MIMSRGRIIGIVVLGTGCFLMGYYNEPICTFFFNKDALIGLLSTLLVAYFLYTQYLEKKMLRKNEQSNYQYSELEDLRYEKRQRKEIKTMIAETKAELIEEMHKLYKQAKNK